MSRYAENTTVSPEKSQEEIKRILRKYGADRFGVMEEKTKAHLMFEFKGLLIQMTVDFPDKQEYKYTENGRMRSENVIETAWNQAIKQRWRALSLAVKAKLEAVEVGISTIEQEFLAFVIMPDGKSLSDHLIPNIREIAASGKMPKMLGFNHE
jgi:hypothetical protein